MDETTAETEDETTPADTEHAGRDLQDPEGDSGHEDGEHYDEIATPHTHALTEGIRPSFRIP